MGCSIACTAGGNKLLGSIHPSSRFRRSGEEPHNLYFYPVPKPQAMLLRRRRLLVLGPHLENTVWGSVSLEKQKKLTQRERKYLGNFLKRLHALGSSLSYFSIHSTMACSEFFTFQ